MEVSVYGVEKTGDEGLTRWFCCGYSMDGGERMRVNIF